MAQANNQVNHPPAVDENQVPDPEAPQQVADIPEQAQGNQWFFFDWKSGNWSQITNDNMNLFEAIQVEVNIQDNLQV